MADRSTPTPLVDRQVPVLVTVTRQHVVWVDALAGEDAEAVVADLREDPYDFLARLDDRNADDIGLAFEHAPGHHLADPAHGGLYGPTLPSSAWSVAEHERHLAWERTHGG